MIKRIRSKLSVKVFMITSILMVSCCAITYLCIASFSPYIYTHELAETEELANLLSVELSYVPEDEAQYFIQNYCDILTDRYDDEFIYHIFRSNGEEVALPHLDTSTDKRIEDYNNVDKTSEYTVSFADRADEYILFIAKNTNKESQVIEALQKSLPILSVVILAVSVIAAFFYTWYMTKPIKKISRLVERLTPRRKIGVATYWRRRAEYTMILPYSHSPSVKSVAGNG